MSRRVREINLTKISIKAIDDIRFSIWLFDGFFLLDFFYVMQLQTLYTCIQYIRVLNATPRGIFTVSHITSNEFVTNRLALCHARLKLLSLLTNMYISFLFLPFGSNQMNVFASFQFSSLKFVLPLKYWSLIVCTFLQRSVCFSLQICVSSNG